MTIFKKKESRIVAFVTKDGVVEVYTRENLDNTSSIYPYVDDKLNILGAEEKSGTQSKKINVYEDVMHAPEQYIYSVPYSVNKMPERSNVIPTEVFNILWNYLEGARGKDKSNVFAVKQLAAS